IGVVNHSLKSSQRDRDSVTACGDAAELARPLLRATARCMRPTNALEPWNCYGVIRFRIGPVCAGEDRRYASHRQYPLIVSITLRTAALGRVGPQKAASILPTEVCE